MDSVKNFFPKLGKCAQIVPMKIVGRKVIAECDVSPLAKKRLALWIKQLADLRWTTLAHMLDSHPDVKDLGNSRFGFPFSNSGIEVEALAYLELEVICIEKVIEQKAKQG